MLVARATTGTTNSKKYCHVVSGNPGLSARHWLEGDFVVSFSVIIPKDYRINSLEKKGPCKDVEHSSDAKGLLEFDRRRHLDGGLVPKR
jgi:hypothetical protein